MNRNGHSRCRGKALENVLERLHEMWRTLGIAAIDKLEVPKRYDPVMERMVYLKKTGFDFTGTRAGGRSICVEAKTSRSGRLGIHPKSGIRTHQCERLIANGRMGAIALVLWYREDLNQVRIVPWWLLSQVLTQGRKSILWQNAFPVEKFDYLKAYDLAEKERHNN